jgi:NMD protein affecting ribosome stability and mRNA decay
VSAFSSGERRWLEQPERLCEDCGDFPQLLDGLCENCLADHEERRGT